MTNVMFYQSEKNSNALLLKHLLVNHRECPDKDLWPKNAKEWGSFIDMAFRNKLVTLLYHFVMCKDCSTSTPAEIGNLIQKHYIETVIRYKNYQKIKNKIRQFIKETGTPLILIKDLDQKLIKKYYPPYYVVQKFDIDIFGKHKDLEKFKKFMGKIGYDDGYHYGAPDKPIPQYKFSSMEKKSFYPQIEFRYKAFMIHPTKKNILEPENIETFTVEIWKTVTLQAADFGEFPREFLFVYHLLICYFEDNCRGLNNLYRVWVLYRNNNQLDWKIIDNITRRYKVTNILNFIQELSTREFSFPRCHLERGGTSLRSTRLALILIDSDYICRAKLPSDDDFNNWKDGYIHFLTRGLLAEGSFWQKILFFCHPKRLLFLVWDILFYRNPIEILKQVQDDKNDNAIIPTFI